MASIDFEIYEGENRTLTLKVVDDGGSPLNLSSANGFEFAARKRGSTSNEIDLDETDTSKMTTSNADGTDDQMNVILTPIETTQTPGIYDYQIRVEDSNGDFDTVKKGTFELLDSLYL